MHSKLARCLIALAVVCALLFVPIPEKLAPEWDVRVVDDHGAPVAGATVYESWQFFGVEQTSHNRQALTDGSGVVRFSAERGWASLAQRARGRLASFADWMGHTSYGPRAWVFVLKRGHGTTGGGLAMWKGESGPMTTTVTMEPCDSGRVMLGC